MRAAERITLAPAYVLHQHDWRESSRIVEIFSREYGRLGLVARGARRAGSPWRAMLRPFQPLLISWVGGGELGTLTGIEAAGVPCMLGGQALLSGFYMNELLLRFVSRQDPHPGLFAQYGDGLDRLMRETSAALRVFEKRLLAAVGYGLILEREAATGQPVESGALYRYELERGPVRVREASAQGLYVTGDMLLALAGEDLRQREQILAARRLLRAVLDRHLEGRPLKTRAVMRGFGKAGV